MEDSRIEALLDAVPALAVLAGQRLDLFTHAASEPRTAAELAGRVGGDERRLEALLHALAALDLLEVRTEAGGAPRFLCRPEAARRLAAGGEDYAGHGRELAARLWAAGLTVADSIRQGAATAPHAAGGDSAEGFLRALHPGALRTGREIARRGWLDGCRRIVDAGGGSGGLAAALRQDLPGVEVSVVERGSAAPWTRRLLEEEGAAAVRVVEGDLAGPAGHLEDRLDLPCDGVVCLSVLQVLGPEEAAGVIARVAGWLRPGGRLVIAGMGGARRRPALAPRLGGPQHPARRPLRRRPRLHPLRAPALARSRRLHRDPVGRAERRPRRGARRQKMKPVLR